MFVTLPQFHQPLLSAVALGGQQHWSAVTALFPVQPWYLFVHEANYIDSRLNHTVLVAWEESLIKIIASVPAQDHRAVYRVAHEDGGRLAFKAVASVWAPTPDEDDVGIGAVFQFEGENELVGPDLTPLESSKTRALVFKAGASAASAEPRTN